MVIQAPGTLSYSQERFWFLHQLDPDCAYYHECVQVCIRGPLNVTLLETALAEVIRRHHVLRSNFRRREGRPTSHLRTAPGFSLPLVDLAGLPDPDKTDLVQQLAQKEAHGRLDLEADLPIRAKLLRCRMQEHVLILTLHHIVADTWSMGIILTELQTLFAAWGRGAPSPMPELPLQYEDIARSERSAGTAAKRAEHLRYWTSQLAGIQPCLALPTDRQRGAGQGTHGARVAFGLDAFASSNIRALARRQGVTLFMVLLAAFKVVLHRYTAETDIVVASPVSNRVSRASETLIGPFLNVLLLRTDLSGDPSFARLVERVKTTCARGFSHAEAPLQSVIRQTPELRAQPAHPFNVMFALQNAPLPRMQLGDMALSTLDLDRQSAVFDLDLQIWDGAPTLHGWLHYRTELFDAATVNRMVGHLETALGAVVAAPECRISELPLLSAQEVRTQRLTWNATATDPPPVACVHAAIEAQATRTPDATAVVFENARLSFAGLQRRANRLAHHLRASGVGPDDVVGLCMARSDDLVVALLAVLKAGGAFLPLDPDLPPDRLALMVQTSRPVCVLADIPRRALPFATDVLSELALETQPDTPPGICVLPDNLAYVLFTSGSTGAPKGVGISHRALLNRLCWMQAAYALDANDRVLQKTPFSFDVSVWEFFWPLITGATLVMARPKGHLDAAYLIDTIEREHISTLHFVPSMLRRFLDAKGAETCRRLRRVICSGEELPPDLARQCLEKLPASVHNLYGPTEAAIDVAAWHCTSIGAFIPIGRPVANTQLYVTDKRHQLAPIGVAGELVIGGAQVARGYIRRPDLTAERFVPDPFHPTGTGQRLYRTGDKVSASPDGVLRFHGRLDRQVKWNGARIELAEVELTLEKHPEVRQAMVELVVSRAGQPDLCAFVVSEPGCRLKQAELRRFLGASLPDHSVPSRIVQLDEFPLSSNGKLDRKAILKSLDTFEIGDPDARQKKQGAEPLTALQQQILDVWRQLFDRRTISIEDDFFDLGGHSMLAVQFVNQLYKAHGIEISVGLLFDRPTVIGLSEAIETERWLAAAPDADEAAETVGFEI
ncbi:non-ribosomal peptide synthetase [Roseivivax sp. CAU 1753]